MIRLKNMRIRVPDEVAATAWKYANDLASRSSEVKSALVRYKTSFVTSVFVSDADGNEYPSISYRGLPPFLAVIGLTAKELFAMSGHTFQFPTEASRWLADALEPFPANKIEKLKALIRLLTVRTWWDDSATEAENGGAKLGTPAHRVMYVINNRVRWAGERAALVEAIGNETFTARWKGFGVKSYAALTLEEQSRAAELLEMSLTWILGLVDDETCLIASSPDIEFIVAGFLFLRESDRNMFVKLVERMANEL